MKYLLISFISFYTLSVVVNADTIYSLPVWSIDSGVSKSQSSSFTLSATIGQSEAGKLMKNSNYTLSGGFLFPPENQNICMVPIIMYLLD